MSLELIGGSSEYFEGVFPQLSHPWSSAVWFKTTTAGGTMAVWILSETGVLSNYGVTTRATNDCSYTHGGGGTMEVADNLGAMNSASFTAHGSWILAVTIEGAATVHRIIVRSPSGLRQVASPSNYAMVNTTRLRVGANHITNFRYYTGRMEALTFWNRALTLSDIHALANRTHPMSVARSGIIASYANMGATPSTRIEDFVGGYHVDTVGGTPEWNPDTPRLVYQPYRSYFPLFQAAAAGGSAPSLYTISSNLRF